MMKVRFAALNLVWMMAVSFPAAAYTGVLRFQGAIYEEGCAMGSSEVVDFGGHSRYFTVSPGIVLEVDGRSKACGYPVVFSTSYRPIGGKVGRADSAIVIVSYQ